MNDTGLTHEEIEFLMHSNWIEGEIRNFALEDAIIAWKYIKGEKELTVNKILILHNILMQHINPRIAGVFRECAVYVGGRAGANFRKVPVLMQKWVEDVAISIKIPGWTGNNIKVDHVEFEKIHPFEDGNGRTGRILMNWERIQCGLPLLIIHEGDEQLEYYKWFK